MQGKFLDLVNGDAFAKLSPAERGQALVDLQTEILTKASEASSAEWDNRMAEWTKEITTDPTVGGAKYEGNKALVNSLVTKYGSPELNQMLSISGMGNNVHLFKLLLNLAPFALEGGNVGGNPGGTPADPEAARLARMFPSNQPKAA